jgi:hypothetical protein
MFSIGLKNNRAEIEIITTRALLAIAGVAAFVYADTWDYYLGIAGGMILFIASFFVKTILDRYKINRLFLLGIAAVLTYITSGSIGFAIVLFVHGIFFEFLNKKVKVELDTAAIIVHYVFYKKTFLWVELNNVILKDRILTVDFKSNKLLQSEIAEESFEIDEKKFNRFCTDQLQSNT